MGTAKQHQTSLKSNSGNSLLLTPTPEKTVMFLEYFARLGNSASPHSMILNHGVQFRQHSPDILKYPPGQPRHCYLTSTRLAIDPTNRLYYVEGFAIHPASGFPIPHAWNTNRLGHVIDTTWGTVADPTQYWGVVFRPSWLTRYTTTHVCGVFCEPRTLRSFRLHPRTLATAVCKIVKP
jgi:hypothetical protein